MRPNGLHAALEGRGARAPACNCRARSAVKPRRHLLLPGATAFASREQRRPRGGHGAARAKAGVCDVAERARQVPRRRVSSRQRTSRFMGVGSSNRKNQWQARILVHGKARARARPAGRARRRPPHACGPGCEQRGVHSWRAGAASRARRRRCRQGSWPVTVMGRVG